MQISTDPEFNGYEQIVKIAEHKEGLLHLHSLFNDDRRFFQEVERWSGQESSPLKRDLSLLFAALEKPMVTAPLRLTEGEAVGVPHSAQFEEVVSALLVVPKIHSRNPDPQERVQANLEVLRAGRKIAREARVMKHYSLGISVQEAALEELARVIKKGGLRAGDLRDLVAGLQMQVSSPQELVAVLDTEYLLASNELALQKQEPAVLGARQEALAARYMKMRPHFNTETPPSDGFVSSEKKAEGQPDYLVELGRSREAATRLAAVELQAALSAYKLEKGAYPASLEELVPAYLTRVPSNSLAEDGRFEYELRGESYRLHWDRPTSRPSGSSTLPPSLESPRPNLTPSLKR